jgi:hypothetical protein
VSLSFVAIPTPSKTYVLPCYQEGSNAYVPQLCRHLCTVTALRPTSSFIVRTLTLSTGRAASLECLSFVAIQAPSETYTLPCHPEGCSEYVP